MLQQSDLSQIDGNVSALRHFRARCLVLSVSASKNNHTKNKMTQSWKVKAVVCKLYWGRRTFCFFTKLKHYQNIYHKSWRPHHDQLKSFYVIFSSLCVLVCLNAYGVMRGTKYCLVLRKIKLNTSWNTLKLYHLLLTKSSSLTSVIYKSIFSFTLHWIKTKKQQHTIYW